MLLFRNSSHEFVILFRNSSHELLFYSEILRMSCNFSQIFFASPSLLVIFSLFSYEIFSNFACLLNSIILFRISSQDFFYFFYFSILIMNFFGIFRILSFYIQIFFVYSEFFLRTIRTFS